jgi:tripartite-type tricarboxylate transporter receptor subunit TctC
MTLMNCTYRKLFAPLAFALTLGSLDYAAAQSVEQFYRGRTITVLVASQAGGVNDLVARLISRHLGNHRTCNHRDSFLPIESIPVRKRTAR